MINDNKLDFMTTVKAAAEDYKKRSFESCMEGFMSSMIKDATTIDAPKNVDIGIDAKEAILNTVTDTINTSAKEFVQNAVSEAGEIYNVNVAHEIVNPKDLSESVMQLVAAHVCNEAEDRAKMLEADFDSGKINNMSFEDASNYVDEIYKPLFIKQLDNGRNLKQGLEVLMSTEAIDLVGDIKNTVSKLVLDTEAKNSVIREAVSEINSKKADIEKKINGESDEEKESKDDNNDSSTDDNSTGDASQATEGLLIHAMKRNKNRHELSREELFTIRDIGGTVIQSGEDWSKNYDKTSFSREAANDILDQFRELDDGIDPKTVNDDEAFSVSGDEGSTSIDNDGSEKAESAETNYYVDDNGDEVEEFKSSYDNEITPEPVPSIESMARDILPMNLKKIGTHKFESTPKLTAYLAFQKDKGESFFTNLRTRHIQALELLQKTEGDVIDGLAKSDIESQLGKTLDDITNTEESVTKLVEDMGIAGILDDKFQRTSSAVDNAVKSLFNPEIIKPMDVTASKEELHEHELADIFKLALKESDVKSEIAKRCDVIGNKEQLGYIDELLNEKMLNLEPGEKLEVENKITALESIESQIPLSDLMDMHVFCSAAEGTDNHERVKLESLKDIDAYGFSYFEESEKIKDEVRKNWKDYMKNSGVKYNIDTDKLVEFVLEQQDTTKVDSNIFEKVLSKLSSDKQIENSTEALIIRNKAKAISTAYITAEKLGFLSQEDIVDFRNYVM